MIRKLRANLPKYINHFKFYGSTLIDWLKYRLFSKKKFKSPAGSKGVIVFVTEDPRIDIVRLFNSLKKVVSSEFILMIPHSKLDSIFEKAGFKDIVYYRNHFDFRLKFNKIDNIKLVHGFTRRCFVIKIILEEHKLPVIISVKDTSVSSHGINPPHWYLREEIPAEKYVFEHVDGIIAESLEVCHAYRLFNSQTKPGRIYFPNYCEEEKSHLSEKKISDEEIHLVYAGSIRGKQDNPNEHGNIQMHWLIETLNAQKIHFHIYPNPGMSRVVYDEYFLLAESLPYFQMHESLDPKDLNKEMSQYHYGIIPFFNADTKRSPLKRYYSSSLKIFNYAESGLPILISNDMGHQRWIMERYGLAVGMEKQDFFELKKKLDNYEYSHFIKNIKKHRKTLTLENQISRVDAFYNLICCN